MAIHVPLLLSIYGGILKANEHHKQKPCVDWGRYSNIGLSFGRTTLQAILDEIGKRVARSGRVNVDAYNKIMLSACYKYSGAPRRSFEAREIDGMGLVYLNKDGRPQVKFEFYEARSQCLIAEGEANDSKPPIPFSEMKTRRVRAWEHWQRSAESSDFYSITYRSCSWCGSSLTPHQFWMAGRHDRRRSGLYYVSTFHCKSPVCRHMDWLQSVPETKGGIRLTRKESSNATEQQRTLLMVAKYLKTKAKAANTRKAK